MANLLQFLISGGGAQATQTIGVTNTNLFFSPYNTHSDGAGAMQASNVKASSTYARMVNTGAYLKFRVTVSGGAGNVSLLLDTTAYNGLTAADCPTIAYSRGNRPFTNQLLAYSASPVSVALATGLSNGTYSFEVRFKSIGVSGWGASADRWATPAFAVTVTGVVIDASASIASQTLKSNRIVVFGDSCPECGNILLANNDSANDLKNASNDAFQGWPRLVAEGHSAEWGLIAYGGEGFTKGIGNTTASSTHPSFYNATDANESWNKYFSGATRDLTSPVTPDVIYIHLGNNDSSLTSTPVTAVLDEIRTAVGATPWIFVVLHGNGSNDAAITTGVANVADTSRTKLLSIVSYLSPGTPSEYSGDAAFGGGHLNYKGHALRASYILEQAVDYIESASGGGNVGSGLLRGAVL